METAISSVLPSALSGRSSLWHGLGKTRTAECTRISGAGIVVRMGRKWRAAEVQQAEAQLNHKVLVGCVAQGRAGLGSSTSTRYNTARGKERRRIVQEEVCASVEEDHTSRTVAI